MGYYDVLGNALMLGDDADDILGDYEVLGDDYDLLGAAKKARKRKRSAAVAQAVAQRSALVSDRAPTQSRRLLISVDSVTAIAAGAASTITVNVIETYRPEVFMVDPGIASGFVITDIKIGRKSQLVGTGALAASTLTPSSQLAGLQFDTAQTSQPLQVAVLNTSAAALRFMATLIGTAVE